MKNSIIIAGSVLVGCFILGLLISGGISSQRYEYVSENVIFDIDWQGTQQIKSIKLKYKIITIFILPPSKEELFNRLLKRDKKDQRIASERMKQFKTDITHWKDYDYTVINDKIEKCYKQIMSFIAKQKINKKKSKYNKQRIKNHIKKLLN